MAYEAQGVALNISGCPSAFFAISPGQLLAQEEELLAMQERLIEEEENDKAIHRADGNAKR